LSQQIYGKVAKTRRPFNPDEKLSNDREAEHYLIDPLYTFSWQD